MTSMTVRDALAVPALRGAGPVVLAGAAGLGREVRWVHTTELVDIAPLLRGGDLVLSTGIALPDRPAELAAFAESLHRSEAAGLVIELGRRWTEVPRALVEACERLSLPLVALAREVRFATVAQAVGERIVDSQLEELREAQRVHEVFTELSIAEAGPAEILESVQRLAGATVVLEDEQHRVVDYRTGPGDAADALADWPARSRVVVLDGRTTWDEANGWLVTRVGRRDRGWGRLVIESPDRPPQRLVATAERAAAALALHRLHDRQRDSLVRRTHHELMVGLLADPGAPDVQRRCELAGVPLARRRLVGLALRRPTTAEEPGRRAGQLDAAVAAVAHAVHELRLSALVCEIDGAVRVLLSLDPAAAVPQVTEDLAGRVHRRVRVVVGAGRPVDRVGDVGRTLRESLHVVDSVRPGGRARPVHRLEDVHLRGLLTMLADDERLRLFTARELDALKEHDARAQSGLLDTVRALVRHPGSKSDAAAGLHVSRSAFYDRLARVEQLLGVDLDDPDILVSLHVAVLADEVFGDAAG
ncbi:purine catabolism regulatory protein [Geodermatophilus africanus]|uniref:Purine catabolism regulatory protein n=2 Tax=Geodermatophilus africanus TaxID=1137993 RepID=A0A1H3Q0U3_9ACTN|nr:purine catabolism regulatory protein [Geodermatophilus africanus]